MKQISLMTCLLIVCATLLILDNERNPEPQQTITPTSKTITTGASLVDSGMDDYIKKIQSYAEKHDIKPIDAKIDPVWKAIPGYNGLTVDVTKTYKMMLDGNNFDTNHLVFKEDPPNVHLDDLPPSPIYKGNPEKPMIALLINVAWGEEHIPHMLKTLKESEVKATFFFDGSWVKRNPSITKMINLEGHEIGNHAYSHPNLNKSSLKETQDELRKTSEIIDDTLGVKPKWFAPPSGSFNQQTVDVAHELGMKTILWTVDTVDWKKPDTSEMVTRVLSKVENGSMILMHPTKPSAEGLEAIIKGAKEKGLHLGTVSNLMSEKRVDPYK
ncbi:polysaccharide deacetylase family protein [Sporosarcina sp. P13]|uniref:polysaccharide deacetylase family protein n=1 Tax=Sporosarcina sp. P13 TaxID=2048263 RepID=UPI001E334300|nr:polysaccharide deacetylase family protein [Sporosarcina sp. P13]